MSSGLRWFEVVGVDKRSGRDARQVFEAPSAEQATQIASSAGLAVASVREVGGPGPDRLSSIRRPAVRREVRRSGALRRRSLLWDFLMFRRMLAPWCIRVSFAIALVGGVALIIAILIDGPSPGLAWPARAGSASGSTRLGLSPAGVEVVKRILASLSVLYSLVVLRLVLEWLIVVFQIHELLHDDRIAREPKS